MTILQKHLVFIPVFFVAMVALLGALVMWLWNWLMPEIFGLPMLSFWQSVGLLVLCRLLVGNIGLGGHHHAHGHCGHEAGSHNKLRERWACLSPQERQQFIEKRKSDDSAPVTEDGK